MSFVIPPPRAFPCSVSTALTCQNFDGFGLKQQVTAAAAAATPESQTGHANEAPSTPEIHQ